MSADLLCWLCLAWPALGALLAATARSTRVAILVTVAGALGAVPGLLCLALAPAGSTPVYAARLWWRVDALSAFHLLLLAVVYGLSSLYAWVYLDDELRRGRLGLRQARLFGGLWCGALAAMTLLLISNNLGLMWVGMEATTLLTAFLISAHVSRESLEAMWKYVLICSVAVAFAFMGTLLTAAAAPQVGAPAALFWTGLMQDAPRLDPRLMRAAFIFLLVGYGTKAGLAPMHNWLPDAHSQAPAPVSAIFSGFMLNAALYCILRFLPILDAVPGCAGWGRGLLAGFGLLSLAVGAGFILFQRDAKRLLAYCSVEHIGLVGVGASLGWAGLWAALFHSLNHSLAKCLAFFATGRLGQACGSHDIQKLGGSLRVSTAWGVGLLASCLALMGAAPFATFMSELQILKAAFDGHRVLLLVGLLSGLALAFVGLLRHTIRMSWAYSDGPPPAAPTQKTEWLLVCVPLGALVLLTLWLPPQLSQLIGDAARVVSGAKP